MLKGLGLEGPGLGLEILALTTSLTTSDCIWLFWHTGVQDV